MTRTKSQILSPVGVLTAVGANISGIITASSFVGTNSNISGIASATNFSGTFANYTEKINDIGNTGTASTINLSNGSFVTAILNSNTTFTFNVGIATGASSFALFLTNDSTPGRTITWPISVVWPGGTVPTRTTTANKTDVYTFFTLNNGSTWYGNIAQYNY
jgi:hypothetical protein